MQTINAIFVNLLAIKIKCAGQLVDVQTKQGKTKMLDLKHEQNPS